MKCSALWLIAALASAETLPGDRTISAGSVVNSVNFTADGKSIAANCRDGKLRLWDARTGELQRTLPLEKGVSGVMLARQSDTFAGVEAGKIKVWNLKTGETASTLSPVGQPPRRIGLSKDQKLTAVSSATSTTGSEDTIRVYDAAGKERFAVAAGIGGTSTISFSPDGSVLVASSYDTNVRAYSTRNGELVRFIEEIPVAMFDAAFSPDGKIFATAGADRIVYLFDAKSGRLQRKLPEQPEMISSLAFSPNGRLLLTGGFSVVTQMAPVKLMLWDLESVKPIRTLDAAHRVGSVAFSTDGTLAASTSGDDKIHVWGVPASK